MAFTLPNFNLTCNVRPTTSNAWPPGTIPATANRLTGQACALVCGHRSTSSAVQISATTSYPTSLAMFLLLPVGTDVRGMQDSTGHTDAVECPAGTGRWYQVGWVDDVAKGYPNEHRVALLFPLQFKWVAPYP